MYARVATFENGDPSRVDELVGTVRERMSSGEQIPGARRFLILRDREAGASLGIAFFDSADAMRAAEPMFESMGDDIPEEVRGRRTSVRGYEVAIEQVADGAHAARVSSLEGSPDGIDDGILFMNESIVPELRDVTGWRGVIALVDRGTGSTKVITLWDDVDSLAASEDLGDQLRRRTSDAMGESIARVERFEIALHEAPIAV